MIEIQEITNKQVWDDFIDKHCVTTFMQSWNFGTFENNTGHEIFRIGITDNHVLQAVCQIVVIHAKKGSFIYIPHGPIFSIDLIPENIWKMAKPEIENENKKVAKDIFDKLIIHLKNLAKEKNCAFIRFNTSLIDCPDTRYCTSFDSMVKSPIYQTSENAAVLDISSKDPQKLLQQMRKTTRYSIKKAINETVTVVQMEKEEFFKHFMKLYSETESRERFVGYSEKYLRHEFEAFEKDNSSISLVAFIEGKAVSAGLFLLTKNSLFYHQGASNHPKIPAPYLLQWFAINFAIENGCKYFNFWGTHIPGRTPAWQGLSLFKLGFGSTLWSYLPTFDIVIDWKRYIFTYIVELVIRFRRGV